MKMFQDENPIPYEDLYVGMEVRDKDGNIGVISQIIDSHNVQVEYSGNDYDSSVIGGGVGLHCLNEECTDEFDPLYKK